MESYLTQRIKHKTSVSDISIGVDRHFDMDYMGSSEFEFSALGKSLKEIRKSPCIIKEISVTVDRTSDNSSLLDRSGINTFSCWYVGSDNKNQIECASNLFKQELHSHYNNLKEHPRILNTYLRDYLLETFTKISNFKNEQTKIKHRLKLSLNELMCQYSNFIGWWDILNHFVIFKNKEDAELWCSLMTKESLFLGSDVSS